MIALPVIRKPNSFLLVTWCRLVFGKHTLVICQSVLNLNQNTDYKDTNHPKYKSSKNYLTTCNGYRNNLASYCAVQMVVEREKYRHYQELRK